MPLSRLPVPPEGRENPSAVPIVRKSLSAATVLVPPSYLISYRIPSLPALEAEYRQRYPAGWFNDTTPFLLSPGFFRPHMGFFL
ncbi:hypothetical protein LIER_40864 [Lithospermum erythrorhizon]|uniref:Uncharacterized protein n=1 Tax=Lithospermum erythrorhizon TaxID=34254 RepID=A0AAV3R306_LITER